MTTLGSTRTPQRRWFIASASTLAAAHLALVQYFVPWRAVFSPRPLQGIDYDLHIGQVFRVVEGLRGWGKSWVYDVRLLAGHPEGTITDAGSKGWELWTYCLNVCGVSLPIAFNTWVLLAMLACPVLAYAAARSFELPPAARLLAAGMASALLFFDSFTHWAWYVGMVSWTLASCLCPLTLGLFYQFMRTRKPSHAIGCALALGIGHLIHPYTFFVLVAPIAALYVREFRRLPSNAHLAVAGMGVFTLAVNAYWLVVAAKHWHYILDSAYYAQGKPTHLVYDFLGLLTIAEDTGVIGVRSGFRFLFFALGIAGLVGLRRRADPRTLPLATGILSLIALAHLGFMLHVFAQMQPYRVVIPMNMLTVVPASMFLHASLIEIAARPPAPAAKLLLAVLALIVGQHLAQEVLYFAPRALATPADFSDGEISPLTTYGFLTRFDGPNNLSYSLPHEAYVEPSYENCVRWLELHVHKGARLLVEGSVLGERLAWRTQFEVIGGFVQRNVSHAYANYFRRYPKPPSQAVLANYLRIFAIDYVVTPIQRSEFDGSPALQLFQTIGRYRVYRAVHPPSRLLEGRGSVQAQTNRIDVTDSDPQQPLVLSYHFHEALRCTPNCTVEREAHAFDPVGLIRIPAPHARSVRIYNAYE